MRWYCLSTRSANEPRLSSTRLPCYLPPIPEGRYAGVPHLVHEAEAFSLAMGEDHGALPVDLRGDRVFDHGTHGTASEPSSDYSV